MTVAIEFDVPIDVVDEMAQASVVVLGAVERVEKPAATTPVPLSLVCTAKVVPRAAT